MPPPPLPLPFESRLCPPSISLGAQNWSLSSLSILSVLRQGRESTLRRCTVIRGGGGGGGGEKGKRSDEEEEEEEKEVVDVVVKTLSSEAESDGDDKALSEASAHASAFSMAPEAVLPLYAAFREETDDGDGVGEEEEEEEELREEKWRRTATTTTAPPASRPCPPPLHLVLAPAAGTSRDAAAGSGGFLLEEHASAAVLSALRGCAALHSVGLIHGDVKPENLLILPRSEKELRQELWPEKDDEEEEQEEEAESSPPVSSASAALSSPSSCRSRPPRPPRSLLPFSFALSDFGSVQPIGGPPPLGTLDFLHPEALARLASSSSPPTSESVSFAGGGDGGNGETISSSSFVSSAAAASPAADVWAIGATAVDLLTGSPPFAAAAAAAAAAAGARQKPETTTATGTRATVALATLAAASEEPLRLPKHLSREARSFCELCLRKRAEERPSASELCRHEWFFSSSSRRGR